MIIRQATHNDVSGIARVNVDTWQTTYQGIISDEYLANLSYKKRASSWKKILSKAYRNSIFTYVAENELGKIIGFANGGLVRDYQQGTLLDRDSVYEGELYAIYILESNQRQGIGRCLFQTVAEKLVGSGINSMLVWVLADNPACRFYDALGGRRVSEKQIERGGKRLAEVAYGWLNIASLVSK